jgi:hypothetical protein
METYGGVDVWTNVFLTSALVWSEWSVSRPGRFTPGERATVTHRIGCWVCPRAGLDDMEKLKFLTIPAFELQSPGRPTHSQSDIPTTVSQFWNFCAYAQIINCVLLVCLSFGFLLSRNSSGMLWRGDGDVVILQICAEVSENKHTYNMLRCTKCL